MKKFLVVLLSLGLIVSFAATASATDVKFNGEYYVWGVYHQNARLAGDDARMALSYVQTQTRVRTIFNVADGLTFTTRFDALEKLWGNTNWKGKTTEGTSSRPVVSATSNGTTSLTSGAAPSSEPKIQESFEFELGWVTFKTAIGTFDVGYQTGQGGFGTLFLNGPQTNGRVAMTNVMGPLTMQVAWDKMYDNNLSNDANYVGKVDADNDFYTIQGIYKASPIEAGLRYRYVLMKADRYKGTSQKYSIVNPYVKGTFGPLYVESEFGYQFGKKQVAENETAAATRYDIDYKSWGAYISATYTIGPAKVGGLFAYTTGNDYKDTSKVQNAIGGSSFMPALILLNNDINGMEGDTNVTNNGGVSGNNPTKSKTNSIWYGVFGSYKVTPKIELGAAFNYATVADKKLSATTEAVSDKLGYEFDMTATYKIYDNLSYMVGGGYLWTGDWWKGTNQANKIDNDYLLMNKLSLTF